MTTYAEAQRRGVLSSRVYVLDALGRAVRTHAGESEHGDMWLASDIISAAEAGTAPAPIERAWVDAVRDGASEEQLVDAVRYAWRTPTGPRVVSR